MPPDAPPLRPAAPRLLFLDALRGIAALGVVVAHFTADQVVEGHMPGAHWLAAASTDPLDLGKTGVALFFLISGYIIPNSLRHGDNRTSRFVVNRFFRLYPLYWFALAVTIGLGWAVSREWPGALDIAANITMVQGFLGRHDIVTPAWTLEIELLFYAACLLLATRSLLVSARSCALSCLGWLVFAIVLAAARYVLVWKLPVALPLALSLMFFGTVWRQATLDRDAVARRLARPLLCVLLGSIVVISVLAYNRDYGEHEHWGRYVLCYWLGIGLFTLGSTRVLVGWTPLVFLGEISYSMYLLHVSVAACIAHAGLTPVSLSIDPVLFIAGQVVVVVACSWVAYRAVERPFVRVGRRIVRVQWQRVAV